MVILSLTGSLIAHLMELMPADRPAAKMWHVTPCAAAENPLHDIMHSNPSNEQRLANSCPRNFLESSPDPTESARRAMHARQSLRLPCTSTHAKPVARKQPQRQQAQRSDCKSKKMMGIVRDGPGIGPLKSFLAFCGCPFTSLSKYGTPENGRNVGVPEGLPPW